MQEDKQPWSDPHIIRHCAALSESFFHWTKKHLIDPTLDELQKSFLLYHGSAVIVSHGTEADPIFNFANQKAQELWKLSWKDFVKLPSRLSAEPIERSEREIFLKEASEKGFISNYTGVRISSESEKFLIKNTILWNVIDGEGNYKGQAAMFSDWELLT